MREEYAVARAKGMSPRAAALHAGYPEAQANKAASRIEPKARETLRQLLPVFAPTAKLAHALADGLDATKHVKAGQDGAYVEVADQRERRETVRLIAELTGELKPDQAANTLTVTLTGPMVERWLAARTGAGADDDDDALASGPTIDASDLA